MMIDIILNTKNNEFNLNNNSYNKENNKKI